MTNYKLNTFNKLKSMMEHNQLYYNVTNDYVDTNNFKKITNIRYNTLTDKCHIMLDEVLEIEFVLDLIYNIFANASVDSKDSAIWKTVQLVTEDNPPWNYIDKTDIANQDTFSYKRNW
jgi:hypothetical protein